MGRIPSPTSVVKVTDKICFTKFKMCGLWLPWRLLLWPGVCHFFSWRHFELRLARLSTDSQAPRNRHAPKGGGGEGSEIRASQTAVSADIPPGLLWVNLANLIVEIHALLLLLEGSIANHCLGSKIVDIHVCNFNNEICFTTKVPLQVTNAPCMMHPTTHRHHRSTPTTAFELPTLIELQ